MANSSFQKSTIATPVTIGNGGTGQTSATAAFDALAPTTTQGDIIYHNGTDNVRLAKGTADQVLTMNAGATAPEWAAAGGGSDGEGYGTGVVWVKAMEAHEGTGTRERQNLEPCIVLTNGADENCSFTARVPSGKTSISAIKMFYIYRTSGNLFIDFDGIQNEYDGGGRVFDSGAGSAAFAASGTNNQLASITVPSTSYDTFSTLASGDLITLGINRTGTSGSDTYEADLNIVGVEFTFA